MPFDATPPVNPVVDTPVVSALKDARQLIVEPEHWCKGYEQTYTEGNYAYCSIGSIMQVTTRGSLRGLRAVNFLERAVYKRTGVNSLIHYNDDTTTTHIDILHAFDLAIIMAQEDNA